MKYHVGQVFSYNHNHAGRYSEFTLIAIVNKSYKFTFRDNLYKIKDYVVWYEETVDKDLTLLQFEDFNLEFSI